LKAVCRNCLVGFLWALVLWLGTALAAQESAPSQAPSTSSRPAVHSHRPAVRDGGAASPTLCASCLKRNLEYLAGPALNGRGSGTEDEHKAANYIAEKLRAYGLAPAAGSSDYIQVGTLRSREVVGNPTLTIASARNRKSLVLMHGQQIVMSELSQAPITAALQKIDLSGEGSSASTAAAGSALLIKLKDGLSTDEARQTLEPYRNGKAAIVIVASSAYAQHMFDKLAQELPHIPQLVGNQEPKARSAIVLTRQETFDQLWAEPDGATVTLHAELTPWKTTRTWNVLAKIEGTTARHQIVLLSAHLDHLGRENGQTYYGADDDASGTVAVMELARALAKAPKPKRTLVVALWGSEEQGLIGARYFLQNPAFPLDDIVANLEFEMIGRPDPKIKPDELWLTGWDRTDLGPELVQHGAKLVADPRIGEQFFTRSDNYALAEKGIIAQTVSSFGLHADYHEPTDTVDKIDFTHLDRAIASMIAPVTWLANTEFKPEWVKGKKP